MRLHFCRYWDVKTGACVRIFYGHQGTITCLDVYKNRLVSGAKDGQVKGEKFALVFFLPLLFPPSPPFLPLPISVQSTFKLLVHMHMCLCAFEGNRSTSDFFLSCSLLDWDGVNLQVTHCARLPTWPISSGCLCPTSTMLTECMRFTQLLHRCWHSGIHACTTNITNTTTFHP